MILPIVLVIIPGTAYGISPADFTLYVATSYISAADESSRLLQTISTGEPRDAAVALLRVVGDPSGLPTHYDDLIQAARLARGSIDLQTLEQACVGYHAWHATTIDATDRKTAILQWICQKIWEMPVGTSKQQMINSYAADMQGLIDDGSVNTLGGLKLVVESVLIEGIMPGVDLEAVASLVARYAEVPDKQVRQYVFEVLYRLGRVVIFDDRSLAGRLFEVLKRDYPDRIRSESADRLFDPPHWVREIRPISWTEYENLGVVGLGELGDQIRKHRCCPEDLSAFARFALFRLIADYRTRPGEVVALLSSLLAEGRLLPEMMNAVDASAVLNNTTGRDAYHHLPRELFFVLLDSFQQNIDKVSAGQCPANSAFRRRVLGCCGWIEEFHKADQGRDSAECREIQERCVQTLVQAVVPWVRYGESEMFNKMTKNPSVLLLEKQQFLCDDAKKAATELAQNLLDDTTTYGDLAENDLATLTESLKRVLTLK